MVAALLVLVPLGEGAVTVFPPKFDAVGWRFGALGLLSSSLLTPSLGLILAAAIAALLDHHRVLRALSVIGGLVAVAVAVMAGVFVLDVIQLRPTVNPQAATGYYLTSTQALLKQAAIVVTMVFFCRGAWLAARNKTEGRGQGGVLLKQPK
jgi:hypothetical protein